VLSKVYWPLLTRLLAIVGGTTREADAAEKASAVSGHVVGLTLEIRGKFNFYFSAAIAPEVYLERG
jgi:hypothetical protein